MKRLEGEFALSLLCRVLKAPRSTVYHRSGARVVKDLSALKATILALRVTHRGYGVRRMFALLRRMGVGASRKEVRRAYAECGILGRRWPRRPRTTDSRHGHPRYPNLLKGLDVLRPDQVWTADVTYVRVGRRFAYLALLMDVFTRRVVGWALGARLGSDLTLEALDSALAGGRTPEIHHSDQDVGYACKAYVERIGPSARLSMSSAGCPKENGYAERLNRTVKEEEVYLSVYESFEDAREALSAYVCHYNQTRLHTALAYRTPSEAFNAWLQEQRESQ